MNLTPKDWHTFQHYKDRSPPWIKLHRGLLHNHSFRRLPLASQALAPLLWLLASEYEGGKITDDLDAIAFKLHVTKNDLCEAINPLIESGFFILDGEPIAGCKHDAIPEKRDIDKTEGEAEKKLSSLRSDFPPDFREQFWDAYPNKKGKAAALKVLEAVRKRGVVPWGRLMDGVRAYAATADPQFTKHPQTWLSKGCWDDEPDQRSSNVVQGPSRGNVIEAADRLVAKLRGLDGPSAAMRADIRSGTGADHVRLLPEGGRQRPGDVHAGDHRDPRGIPGGSGGARDEPQDGPASEVQLPSDCG